MRRITKDELIMSCTDKSAFIISQERLGKTTIVPRRGRAPPVRLTSLADRWRGVEWLQIHLMCTISEPQIAAVVFWRGAEGETSRGDKLEECLENGRGRERERQRNSKRKGDGGWPECEIKRFLMKAKEKGD
ncbi:uncharacterized protein PGTG_06644 [Puccinia graminis f. sp. tritici CRL 75-36-700-3]|uniref:Uncharacterized protein n=1 Tax=Puccinia graminis f. sp. tritici (strain CRL 75-36-700-3 / race SCCL) TaxID=418459 RepID=E3K952_PUCGT|nr:uncharacterized protein PGTG_06644 [Puccinia graminis f. sp. tritici CRL 75-36-700-3]EFP80688.1 hypothetical protein PGTG_06644 [Puccinia graminis f. sp. tritici CRL 75-36-700-3]